MASAWLTVLAGSECFGPLLLSSSRLQYALLIAAVKCASHPGFDIWLYCLLKIILLHFAALVTSTKTLYNSLSAIKGDCNVYVLDMYMYLIALYQQSLIIKADAT